MNSTQVAKVIKTFEKVLVKYPKARLDMAVSAVKNDTHKCGTVHCHAGWYAVARVDKRKHRIDYRDGANVLAADLGFKLRLDLKRWGYDHQDIWGNSKSYGLFSEAEAFTPGNKNRAANLQDIINHWYEVHDRLWLREQFEKETI